MMGVHPSPAHGGAGYGTRRRYHLSPGRLRKQRTSLRRSRKGLRACPAQPLRRLRGGQGRKGLEEAAEAPRRLRARTAPGWDGSGRRSGPGRELGNREWARLGAAPGLRGERAGRDRTLPLERAALAAAGAAVLLSACRRCGLLSKLASTLAAGVTDPKDLR